MPENINWDAVWQSVTDTWLPFIIVAACAVAAAAIYFIL